MMSMFLVRTGGDWRARWTDDLRVRIAVVRWAPSIVAGHVSFTGNEGGQVDLFCLGDAAAQERLRGQGWSVVPLTDGWYADDTGGGVAIWGQGAYWEIRDTPFSVREASRPASRVTADGPDGETLDVRRGVFGV